MFCFDIVKPRSLNRFTIHTLKNPLISTKSCSYKDKSSYLKKLYIKIIFKHILRYYLIINHEKIL